MEQRNVKLMTDSDSESEKELQPSALFKPTYDTCMQASPEINLKRRNLRT